MPLAVSFLFHFPSAFAASLARASCPSVSGLSSTRERLLRAAVTRPALPSLDGREQECVRVQSEREPGSMGDRDGLGSVVDAQLREDVLHMRPDGARADHELARDLLRG